MPNSLTNVMAKILANSLPVLRERCIMPRLVNTDYSMDAAKKGQTIDVHVPADMTAVDVTPSNVLPAPTDNTPAIVQIQLDQWKKSPPFGLNDQEMLQIEANANFLPERIASAVKSVANAINQSIMAQYVEVYGYAGTAGTTPFASNMSELITGRRILNEQLCPLDDRRFVMDFIAEANALARPELANFEQTGDGGVKIDGVLGRKYGFDFFADDHVPLHTAGVPGGTPAGTASAGATTVAVASGGNAGTFKRGDIISFANHTQTYVVAADLTLNGSGAGNLTLTRGLRTAVSGSVITLRGSHRVNLAFNRNAFALAMRPLESSRADLALGRQTMTMQDPVSGLVLRLEVIPEYKQVVWEFDALWGVKCVRPELACRIAG